MGLEESSINLQISRVQVLRFTLISGWYPEVELQ